MYVFDEKRILSLVPQKENANPKIEVKLHTKGNDNTELDNTLGSIKDATI